MADAEDLAQETFVQIYRQTSMAVDITEQTVAKTALENAAMDIAERVVPKLTK